MTKKHEVDDPDETVQADYSGIDWRTRIVSHLTKDVPSAYPGGPSHKAGALILQTTSGRNAKKKKTGFTTPSAVAMAVNLAIGAAESARTLQPKIAESDSVSPWGTSKTVTVESTPALFDYFEQCMVAITFSFQALEAYCNEAISYKVTDEYERSHRNGTQRLSADELERVASTEEKLGTILPKLMDISSPRGTRTWQDFVSLKKARDATVHIKSRDSSPKIMSPDDLNDPTLYHQFLGANPLEWVRSAVAMIGYFHADSGVPLNLILIEEKLNMRAKGQRNNQAKVNPKPRGQRSSGE